jgi:hypothetical protein
MCRRIRSYFAEARVRLRYANAHPVRVGSAQLGY